MVWHLQRPKPPPRAKKAAPAKEAASTESGIDGIKRTLWASADKLRANMDAAEYKHIVLGLIFIKLRLRHLPGAPQKA